MNMLRCSRNVNEVYIDPLDFLGSNYSLLMSTNLDQV